MKTVISKLYKIHTKIIICGVFVRLCVCCFCFTVKTYEDMTLEELEENEDEFGEDDEAAIEMYRWAVLDWDEMGYTRLRTRFHGEMLKSTSKLAVKCLRFHRVLTSCSLIVWPASLLLCRQKRLAEWKAAQMKNVFGDVGEISGQDYVKEVNKAGDGIWVVLHLYKQG